MAISFNKNSKILDQTTIIIITVAITATTNIITTIHTKLNVYSLCSESTQNCPEWMLDVLEFSFLLFLIRISLIHGRR